MTRPLPLLSFFLFALLTTQLPAAAHAQKAGQARRTPSKQAPAKSGAAQPGAAQPAPSKLPLRLVVQQGMRNVTNGFALFSPDGRLVATGHNGGDVVVWDVATGREVRPFSLFAGALRLDQADGTFQTRYRQESDNRAIEWQAKRQ